MNFLTTLTKEYYSTGLKPQSQQARAWFQEKMREYRVTPSKIMSGMKERLEPRTMIGKMYFFYYDAKLKKELPYWDMFPLTIPLDFYRDGFLGINLHYLDYKSRAILLDKLMETVNNKVLDDTTKLKITYQTLAQAARYREIKPCVKRYLYKHIQSEFMPVYANEWQVAIYLPVERFQKADAKSVWEDSKRQSKGQ